MDWLEKTGLISIGIVLFLLLITPPEMSSGKKESTTTEASNIPRMKDILNATDSCLPKKSYLEHFKNKEEAEKAFNHLKNQGLIMTITKDANLLGKQKVYCPNLTPR